MEIRSRKIYAALLVACTALALAALAGSRGTAAAQNSGRGQVLQAGDVHTPSSRTYIHVGKTGLGHEHAVAGMLKRGNIHLDTGKGRLVFDMATFVADTDAARKYIGLEGTSGASTQRQVTDNMLGAQVLDVAHFPEAVFDVSSISPIQEKSGRGLPQYALDGDFTLHGVTQPIRVVADLEEKNGWLHLRGGFRVRQTQYGIRPFTKAFGTIGVADELTIWGDFWVAKQQVAINN